MQCPICSVSLTMTDRQGIEIDYCPKCRGVWLDRGELDKIIERAAGDSSSPSRSAEATRPSRSDHGHKERPYAKRKSMLFELFDF